MFLSRPPWLAYAYGLAVLGLSNATPVEVSVGRPLDDLMYREALAVAHSLQLEKRVSADFDMGKTWDNDILFKGCVGP
jgi:predicted proteasome-type protease